MTLIVILQFRVAPGRGLELEKLVEARAKHHQATKGFEKMYLLRSDKADEYRIVTWWKDLADPTAFVRTESYALSEDRDHAGLIVGTVDPETLAVVRQF